MTSLPDTQTQQKVILIVIGLFVASVIGVMVFNQWRQDRSVSSAPPESAPLSITLGDTNNDNKVVIYTDPACDKCAAYHEDVVLPLYDSHVKDGEVSIEIRPVSIVSEHSAPLNELFMCSSEQNSYLQTMSYVTSNLIDGESGYSESLAAGFFDNHSAEDIAKNTRMDASKLKECLGDTRFDNKLIQADTAAYAADIYSTPTTFIGDSEPVRGYGTLPYITRMIDVHLPN